MPIRISSELPAFKTLGEENIFVMSKERAEHQDIRPLKVIIVNIMPKKIDTENQQFRFSVHSIFQFLSGSWLTGGPAISHFFTREGPTVLCSLSHREVNPPRRAAPAPSPAHRYTPEPSLNRRVSW